MKLSYDELYKNVKLGIEEAPENLIELYTDSSSRIILEALLLDNFTPLALYNDLFGLSDSEVERYKHFFFDLPLYFSRMDIFSFISKLEKECPDEEWKEREILFSEVFYKGYVFIDCKFNRNKNTDIKSYGKTIYMEALVHLHEEIKEGILTKDIKKIKDVVSLLKEGTKLYEDKEDKNDAPTQMVLEFVQEIQKTAKVDEEEDSVEVVGLNIGTSGKIDVNVNEDLNSAISDDIKDIHSNKKE